MTENINSVVQTETAQPEKKRRYVHKRRFNQNKTKTAEGTQSSTLPVVGVEKSAENIATQTQTTKKTSQTKRTKATNQVASKQEKITPNFITPRLLDVNNKTLNQVIGLGVQKKTKNKMKRSLVTYGRMCYVFGWCWRNR